MRRRATIAAVLLTALLGLLPGTGGVASATQWAHVAPYSPAAVGLLPDDAQPRLSPRNRTPGFPGGWAGAGSAALGTAASVGLIVRWLAGKKPPLPQKRATGLRQAGLRRRGPTR